MKLRALLIIVVLAMGLPWPAGAVTREELVCPVWEEWGDKEWETWVREWEEQEREKWNKRIDPGGNFWPEKCPCKKGWRATEEEIQKILDAASAWDQEEKLSHHLASGPAMFCNADLSGANLQGANLQFANLREASLSNANLQGANLQSANLWGAHLDDANLQNANLSMASLHNAMLSSTNLQGADLRSADLQKSWRLDTNPQDAVLDGAKLAGALYAPASRLPKSLVAGVSGLASVGIGIYYPLGEPRVSGMIQLRRLLREAGLREQERQATFAIEHHKALHARQHGSAFERFGGWLQLVFFEWTTG